MCRGARQSLRRIPLCMKTLILIYMQIWAQISGGWYTARSLMRQRENNKVEISRWRHELARSAIVFAILGAVIRDEGREGWHQKQSFFTAADAVRDFWRNREKIANFGRSQSAAKQASSSSTRWRRGIPRFSRPRRATSSLIGFMRRVNKCGRASTFCASRSPATRHARVPPSPLPPNRPL